jgi:hypothetical protein
MAMLEAAITRPNEAAPMRGPRFVAVDDDDDEEEEEVVNMSCCDSVSSDSSGSLGAHILPVYPESCMKGGDDVECSTFESCAIAPKVQRHRTYDIFEEAKKSLSHSMWRVFCKIFVIWTNHPTKSEEGPI